MFLLNEPTSAYLEDIRMRTIKLQSLSAAIDPNAPVADNRAELVDKTYQEKNWLVDQLNIIPEKFRPFLKLTLDRLSPSLGVRSRHRWPQGQQAKQEGTRGLLYSL